MQLPPLKTPEDPLFPQPHSFNNILEVLLVPRVNQHALLKCVESTGYLHVDAWQVHNTVPDPAWPS